MRFLCSHAWILVLKSGVCPAYKQGQLNCTSRSLASRLSSEPGPYRIHQQILETMSAKSACVISCLCLQHPWFSQRYCSTLHTLYTRSVFVCPGSMRGPRETVAKALALECMRAAKAQERGCFVFAFAGPQEVSIVFQYVV